MESITRWQKFKLAFWNWFKNSETILWARLQLIVGAVWTVLQTTDLSSVIPGKYFVYWLIFSGIVTEIVRRQGNTVQTVTVSNSATNFQPVEVQRLERTDPAPPPPQG